ncbi:hypothetical protein AACK17_00645 [Pectobacterium punjabense]|uniref:hypothetical protein n=1 Tax=Pectobacterium punjabense TaxID=2108399 RepID=UPI00311F3F64
MSKSELFSNDDKIELFETLVSTMYGKNWKSEIARVSDINDRTIRQWAAGERPIPDMFLRGLLSECVRHINSVQSALNAAARELNRYMPDLKIIYTPTKFSVSTCIDENKIDWFDVLGERIGLIDGRAVDKNGFDYAHDETLVVPRFTIDALIAAKNDYFEKNDHPGIL